jgi:hypothetical protein
MHFLLSSIADDTEQPFLTVFNFMSDRFRAIRKDFTW